MQKRKICIAEKWSSGEQVEPQIIAMKKPTFIQVPEPYACSWRSSLKPVQVTAGIKHLPWHLSHWSINTFWTTVWEPGCSLWLRTAFSHHWSVSMIPSSHSLAVLSSIQGRQRVIFWVQVIFFHFYSVSISWLNDILHVKLLLFSHFWTAKWFCHILQLNGVKTNVDLICFYKIFKCW